MDTLDELRTYSRLADRLIELSTKEELADAARLLATNLAHYQETYGELPLENAEELVRAQTLDESTANLVTRGLETLVGVLGIVLRSDEDPNKDPGTLH